MPVATTVSKIDIQKRDNDLAERYPEYKKSIEWSRKPNPCVDILKIRKGLKRNTTSVPVPAPIIAYPNRSAGYVYLMEIDFSNRDWAHPFVYKIGQSINLGTRISTISSEWGSLVNLIAYTATQDKFNLEQVLQAKYFKYITTPLDIRALRKNDYFAFNADMLSAIISDWEIHA